MAESEFLAKAISLGFVIAKPWGDSARYDFVLDAGGRLWRVQVKSAYHELPDGGYTIRAHGAATNHVYTQDEVDVLVAYVAPADAWYVIPIADLRGVTGVKLFPVQRRRPSAREIYREAWEMFDGHCRHRIISECGGFLGMFRAIIRGKPPSPPL